MIFFTHKTLISTHRSVDSSERRINDGMRLKAKVKTKENTTFCSKNNSTSPDMELTSGLRKRGTQNKVIVKVGRIRLEVYKICL